MAEIGDIRRFPGKQFLASFAGVDPMSNQSGAMNRRNNKTSKRGSLYRRKALFSLINIHILKTPMEEPVWKFLGRKHSEGKHYYVYITAGANKSLRHYYAKVRDYLNTLENKGRRIKTIPAQWRIPDTHGGLAASITPYVSPKANKRGAGFAILFSL